MDNWIYCDCCDDPCGFWDAVTGLEEFNKATCFDCLSKLRKERDAKHLAQRSRQRRRLRIADAYKSIKGDV